MKCIDGDAVTKLFECDGQSGGRPSLVVVHREAVRIGIDGGPGGVDQNEHAEIAGKFAALQVDVLGCGKAGLQIDEQVDERLDIEVVPVGTAAQDFGPSPTRARRRRSTSSCATPASETSAATVSGKSMTRHQSGLYRSLKTSHSGYRAPPTPSAAPGLPSSVNWIRVGRGRAFGPISCTRRVERTVISAPAAPSPGEREPPNILRK